jgi:geranylgeranyl pyrophosphate synthase
MREPLAGRAATSVRELVGADVSVIADDMERVERLLNEAAESKAHPLVSEAALHLIRAGGKRMRPALVLLSACAGKRGRTSTHLSGAAIELVHIATLYHDDVIDETETRRGGPTAHARWGIEVAVLAGDYLFARGCALGADAGGEVPGILARAIGLVCEGQIMETAALFDADRSLDQYRSVILRKTAALFEAACELGASTSAAGPEDRAALVEYGRRLGLAFQIVDDVLDLLGDPVLTGKERGSDLREGVFTLPVLASSQLDPGLAKRLIEAEEDIGGTLSAVVAGGGVGVALDEARAHAEAAGRALDRFEPSPWVTTLRAVLDGVLAQAGPHPG